MIMNRFYVFGNLLIGISALALVSCTPEDEIKIDQSQVSLSATVATTSHPNARVSELIYGNLDLTDLKMSVDDFELKFKSSEDAEGKVKIETKGPQMITLIDAGEIKVAPIGGMDIQHGLYGKIEFNLFPNTTVSPDDKMYGNSFLVKAVWFGTPVLFYLDLNSEVEINFENEEFVFNQPKDFLIAVYLDRMLANIDPHTTHDGNGDGVIEIGPDDVDGNDHVYQQFKENVKNSLELKDGKFDDK